MNLNLTGWPSFAGGATVRIGDHIIVGSIQRRGDYGSGQRWLSFLNAEGEELLRDLDQPGENEAPPYYKAGVERLVPRIKTLINNESLLNNLPIKFVRFRK